MRLGFCRHIGGILAFSAFLAASALAQDQSQQEVIISQETIEIAEQKLRQAEAAILEQLKKTQAESKKTTVKEDQIPETKAVAPLPEAQVKTKKQAVVLDDGPSNKELAKQIQDLNSRLLKTSKKLQNTRNQLMFSEAEVERLSAMLKERDQALIYGRKSVGSKNLGKQYTSNQKADLKSGYSYDSKSTTDMPIVTVVVDKANLRTGPGFNNSPLMTVAKGTRLAVETRVGEWYRVISPTGARAWVSSEVVRYGKTLKSSPSRTIRVKGFSLSDEDRAFDLIRKHVDEK